MKKILITLVVLASLISSYAYAQAAPVTQIVPTMSEWALILLIVLIALVGLTRFKRKA